MVVSKDGGQAQRFLAVDVYQMSLVEPETKRLGWGVVKFAGLLQVIFMSEHVFCFVFLDSGSLAFLGRNLKVLMYSTHSNFQFWVLHKNFNQQKKKKKSDYNVVATPEMVMSRDADILPVSL